MNSTEKHEMRDRRRVSAMLKRRKRTLDRTFSALRRSIAIELLHAYESAILKGYSDDNNPVDTGGA